MRELKAPFPWFGGKSRVSHLVWPRFGNVSRYIEPFAGSLAVLLAAPSIPQYEIVNDKDRYIANFWRSVQFAPDEVAGYADWPINEADLLSRHRYLCDMRPNGTRERMAAIDEYPEYYDTKIAGWWVWGIGMWIGAGWCDGEWWGDENTENRGRGISGLKQPRIDLNAGIHQCTEPKNQLPHLSHHTGIHQCNDPHKKRPVVLHNRGIHQCTEPWRQLPRLSHHTGVHQNEELRDWMNRLSARLRNVKVCCGDWLRVVKSKSVLGNSLTGIFLDPPYSAERDICYSTEDFDVANDVRAWCLEHTKTKKLRIALCGYEGEHNELERKGWSVDAWRTGGGYANVHGKSKNENAAKERIWFSPQCLEPNGKMF